VIKAVGLQSLQGRQDDMGQQARCHGGNAEEVAELGRGPIQISGQNKKPEPGECRSPD